MISIPILPLKKVLDIDATMISTQLDKKKLDIDVIMMINAIRYRYHFVRAYHNGEARTTCLLPARRSTLR